MKLKSAFITKDPKIANSFKRGERIEGEKADSRTKARGDQPDFALPAEIVPEDESIEEIVRDIPLPSASQHPREIEQSRTEDDQVPDATLKPAYTGRIQTEYDVPKWFPKSIKQIFLVNRHGGQFSFQELDIFTRYRAAMERNKRRKWVTYIKAGRARWQLQKILRRMRSKPFTQAFLKYRKSQYGTWKERALRSWKRLEKLYLGIRVLDEAIDINFRQERMIYEKSLGGRLGI